MPFNESVVCLQFGQCGNQLGFEFYKQLATEISRAPKEQFNTFDTFFRETLESETVKISSKSATDRAVARCVLVDMEPKVRTCIFYPQEV